MSSKQVARLLCKGLMSGVDHIPDSWWNAVPGGYYKAKDVAKDKLEEAEIKDPDHPRTSRSRDRHTRRSTRRDTRRRRRAYSDAGRSDSDFNSDYWSSSDDAYLSDHGKRYGAGYNGTKSGQNGTRDRSRMAQRQPQQQRSQRQQRRATNEPMSSPPLATPLGSPQQQREYFQQYPTAHPPPYNNGPRPYNPADYASIPPDGTTIRDPNERRASQGDTQSMYTTSSWVANQAANPPPPPPQTSNAVVQRSPPAFQPGIPPFANGPYNYSPQMSPQMGVPNGYDSFAGPGMYSPQYVNGLARPATMEGRPRPHRRSSSRSRREKRRRAHSSSPIGDARNKIMGMDRAKKHKIVTPTLAAVASGLVASEVGGAGGFGTLAGAAIGGLAAVVLDKGQQSRSKTREREKVEAVTRQNTEDAQSDYSRDTRSQRRRQQDRARRSYSDGYGSD